jgi:hypothetical protein
MSKTVGTLHAGGLIFGTGLRKMLIRDRTPKSYADGVPETGQTFMSDFWIKGRRGWRWIFSSPV